MRWYYNRIKSYLGRPRVRTQIRPVVIDERERCESPIFIIGVHRSGTSLVRRLFNSHSQIACPPESFFIEHYARMFGDEMVEEGYAAFGMDREAMRQDLARKAGELHEAFRLATGKAIWADKTPHYVKVLPEIDALFGGKARYVFVSRHPLEVVHSLWRRDWRFNEIEDRFESALVYVRDGLDRIERFGATVGERSARIDYARLCADPEAELSQALEAIGLSFEPAMLAFSENVHNYGLEDPVIHGQKGIVPSHGGYKAWSAAQLTQARGVLGERLLELSA